MEKKDLLEAIGEAMFDFSLAINEEFGGYSQNIPEKYHPVLILLYRYETLYVKDLAELLHVSPSSASQLLSKMEAEDYIVRELDPDKRRYTFVKLGGNGVKAIRNMEEIRNQITSKYLMKLSHEELTVFKEVAEKIKTIVERERETAT